MARRDKKNRRRDTNLSFSQALQQLQGLDMRDLASWPTFPRYLFLVFVAVVVFVALWWFVIHQGVQSELKAAQEQEQDLRGEYSRKIKKALQLAELKKQREQVLQYVNVLEKQLPSKSEMDALLSDINQAGLGRSLQFELFRPGQLSLSDYYAELPIALRVTGKYHDVGEFTSDVAHLSRIVTLNDLQIKPQNSDKDEAPSQILQMEATAKTYRYLDEEEMLEQRKAREEQNK